MVLPDQTRAALALSLRTSLNNPGPHLGAFVLPPNVQVRACGEKCTQLTDGGIATRPSPSVI